MGPGTHGSTFGGNPVVCAGANVVVDRMDQSFLANVNERAVQLRAGIAKLPHVKSISGIGLMVGIEFYDLKAADVLAACREAGLLVLTAKDPPAPAAAADPQRARCGHGAGDPGRCAGQNGADGSEGAGMKNLLKMSDLSPAELTHILDVADQLKAQQKLGGTAPLLAGKNGGSDVLQGVHPHPHQL